MNIVDNNVNITKYVNINIKRHTSSSNNTACFIKLDTEYINKENKPIINKHKKILNQKDTNTLIKCTKHNINIVPIMYQLNDDDIHSLINEACKYININMINLINNYIKINCYDLFVGKLEDHITYVACEDGHINIIKYLHKNLGLTKKCFLYPHSPELGIACMYGNINIVKYLHKKMKVTTKDFQLANNTACRWTCQNGHVEVVKYLHKKVKLTKEDFKEQDNYSCTRACINGHINVVKYLHQEVKLLKKDFQAQNNYACRLSCRFGRIEVIKYLHKVIKLTMQDFQSNDNEAYEYARLNGYDDVIKYLHDKILINKHY